jgi:hypothetical protein
LALGAKRSGKMAFEVGGDAIVVEQRVVDVQKKHD